MRKWSINLFAFLLLLPLSLYSQDGIQSRWDGFLEKAGYAKPFISELAVESLILPAINNLLHKLAMSMFTPY